VILLHCIYWQVVNGKMRIALIGQSQFAVEVYRLLRQKHDIVGVFTVPDINGRPDPLGELHLPSYYMITYKSHSFDMVL